MEHSPSSDGNSFSEIQNSLTLAYEIKNLSHVIHLQHVKEPFIHDKKDE
jgi:hypothetical protein